ncbi:12109_t:CDS:1, partial [Funneliformis geosporum]
MGTYDLEKEIYRILQDSFKIRGYNARLRSKYINLNDENRRLKVVNSKLVSQNACTEISLAKAEADNFAKSEEVKSLQSVINLLAPGYSDKNNRSNPHVKGGPIVTSQGEKNDI